MANRRVRVSYGRTAQPAPYESIRLDVAIEKDILDDADLREEVNKSVDGLVKYVSNKIASILADE
jgi:hypothetical protein